MKILYFDCKSGISGDMTVGALLDLKLDGIDIDFLNLQLGKLNLHDEKIVCKTFDGEKNGISGTKFEVFSAADCPDRERAVAADRVYVTHEDYYTDNYLLDNSHVHSSHNIRIHNGDLDAVIDLEKVRRLYWFEDPHHDLDSPDDLDNSHTAHRKLRQQDQHHDNDLHTHEDHDHDPDFDEINGHDQRPEYDHDHDFDFDLNHRHNHSHHRNITHGRNLHDIYHIFNTCPLEREVRLAIMRAFLALARAEAKVHGVTIEEIHFHEVGAIDSIADIAATAILLRAINPDAVLFSDISEGTGYVKCDHGTMPVPVPATLELLSKYNIPFTQIEASGELVTPTGAVIAATFGNMYGMPLPRMTNIQIGVGCGTKDFPQANVLRVMLGDTARVIDDRHDDEAAVIEANIDDMSPEALAYACERLIKEGAFDVWQTPIVMKKGRSAITLSVLCDPNQLQAMCDKILLYTTTIGVRYHICLRKKMDRQSVTVNTPYGKAEVKVSTYAGIVRAIPEYETIARLATANNAPFDKVYQAALNAYEDKK